MDNQKSILLTLLKNALTEAEMTELPKEFDWDILVDMAKKHGVLPLLYDVLDECPQLPKNKLTVMNASASKAVQQSYHLLFLTKYVLECLAKEGIEAVVLKGVATASYYSVPELRKSGDVDLLLFDNNKQEAAELVLKKVGFTKKNEQHALHHVVYTSPDNIDVEVHTMLAEPFDNQEINRYLERIRGICKENVLQRDCMGIELPILQIAYHGYELILHMLQHFLRSGFGVKLLCDWVVFWNREVEEAERNKYLQLIEESGIKGFADMITLCCCNYLGLEKRYVEWMKLTEYYDTEVFMSEILEAEEFGKSSRDRMVVMRGTKLVDYIREFHHQMQLNFPKKGKIWMLWPVLWGITLYRFLYNNRNIRRISSREIFRKARERSEMVEKIKLFKKS